MPNAKYVHGCQTTIDYTPAGAVDDGDVVVQGALIGIALKNIAAEALGALAVTGVYDFPKSILSGSAFAAGVDVYWDVGNQVATETAGQNLYLGKVTQAAADADTTVRVLLGLLALQ